MGDDQDGARILIWRTHRYTRSCLAGLMKALPFHYPVDLKSALWSNNGGFWRYQPDFLIAVFNQLLLLVVAGLTFALAKKMFDSNVAWLSAVLVLGCEMLWRSAHQVCPPCCCW